MVLSRAKPHKGIHEVEHDIHVHLILRFGMHDGQLLGRALEPLLDAGKDLARVICLKVLLQATHHVEFVHTGRFPTARLNDLLIGDDPFPGNVDPLSPEFTPRRKFARGGELARIELIDPLELAITLHGIDLVFFRVGYFLESVIEPMKAMFPFQRGGHVGIDPRQVFHIVGSIRLSGTGSKADGTSR